MASASLSRRIEKDREGPRARIHQPLAFLSSDGPAPLQVHQCAPISSRSRNQRGSPAKSGSRGFAMQAGSECLPLREGTHVPVLQDVRWPALQGPTMHRRHTKHTHTQRPRKEGSKLTKGHSSSVGPQKMLWPPGLERGSTRGCVWPQAHSESSLTFCRQRHARSKTSSIMLQTDDLG